MGIIDGEEGDGGGREAHAFFATRAPAAHVSLTPFSSCASPSPRRLSSHFAGPSRPVPAARKQLAWISLQGRLVGAEEATSARTIGGGLSPKEAVAWELFSPIHRILIVAVVAVAASQSEKNRQILQLQKSVHLRDQVLASMQQKLDDLCEQMSNIKDQTGSGTDGSFVKRVESGHWLCDQHWNLSNEFGVVSASKASNFKRLSTNLAEQEERRMSDLSDWASSSITSASEFQLSASAIDHDISKLKRECEEKDATIKNLSTFLQSSGIAGSKRIGELEDTIRRKSQIIMKLKKDIVVLEQKVVHLTRLRRPSFSASTLTSKELPFMADNVIYDMDSTTSPSSSDSDCSSKRRPLKPVAMPAGTPVQNSESSARENQRLALPESVAKLQENPVQISEYPATGNPKSSPQTPVVNIEENPAQTSEISLKRSQKSIPAKTSRLVRSLERYTISHSASPLQEKSMNQRTDVSSLKPKQALDIGGFKTRKQVPAKLKDSVPPKRWV